LSAIESTPPRLAASRAQPLPRVGWGSPVFLWAAVGAVFVCLAAYVWGAWMLSPWFRPVPVGSDPLPGNVLVGVRTLEVIAATIGVALLWRFVARPLIREGEIGVDGLLLINFLLLWWTDPIDNYVNFSFMYNGHAINMGGWGNFIPGWGYPNHENLPEPLLLMGGFYLGFWMLNTLFGCWLLRSMAERWPRLGWGWRLGALFVIFAAVDSVVEIAILRTGIAAYPGVVRDWSLFPGEVYQWPLYEAGIIAFVNIGWTCLRYFKDDKGQTFVEKGLDRLPLSRPRKKLLTFLALAGFVQPFFLVSYYLPYNLFAIQGDTFPAYPSYMRNMICGEGTQYACPSREWVPIPHRDGKLFIGPDDPRLPQAVRDAQGISASGKDPYAR
jgi:hypothetical protein